jgi:hypothetical protein
VELAEAARTEVWLLTLKKHPDEVEGNTQEAFEARREPTRPLVERITMVRNQDGKMRLEVTYRFGPPYAQLGAASADGPTPGRTRSAGAWRNRKTHRT